MTDLLNVFYEIIVDIVYFVVVIWCYRALFGDPGHWDITCVPGMYLISRLWARIAAYLPKKIQTHWIINLLILEYRKVNLRLIAGPIVFFLWRTICRTIAEGTIGLYDMFMTGLAVVGYLYLQGLLFPVHRRHSLTFSPDRVE